jgi:hypothetical protein
VFWGNPLVMALKVGINNFYYWGCVGLLFFHRKLTDLELMAAVRPDVERMRAILRVFESMFREWNELEDHEWIRGMVSPRVFPGLLDRHNDLIAGFDDDQLTARIAANADLFEAVAVLTFHRAARNLGDAAPGENEKINPYAISLDPERWEADGLFDGTGMSVAEARETPAEGLERMFMEAIAAAV